MANGKSTREIRDALRSYILRRDGRGSLDQVASMAQANETRFRVLFGTLPHTPAYDTAGYLRLQLPDGSFPQMWGYDIPMPE